MKNDLEWVDPKLLKPWDGNPRNNSRAIDAVARSIRKFGFAAPIVARHDTREVIAGHTRLAAALQLNLDSVPVRYMRLSDQEARALSLADNKLSEIATWDEPLLASSLSSLSPDLAACAGFDSKSITKLLEPPLPPQPAQLSPIRATFTLVIEGPLPSQPQILETIKASLASLQDVSCSITTHAHR